MEKLLRTAKLALGVFFVLLVAVILLALYGVDNCKILTYSDYVKYLKIPQSARSFVIYIMALSLATAFISSLSALILASRTKEKKTSRAASFLIFVTIIILIWFLVVVSIRTARTGHPDARRVADMKQIQIALYLYRDEFGSYPVVSGNTTYERWEELKTFLEPAEVILFVPDDHCVKRKENKVYDHQYDYKSTGDTYVARTLLGRSNSAGFISDLDGEVLGIWCGEQGREIEYCVGP